MKLEDNLDNIFTASHILESAAISSDLVTSLCGKMLGRGTFRSVFEYNLDNNYVIKIEHENTFCNVTEYMIWDEVQELCNDLAWVKKWFAPVKWISPNGRVLVMKRTKEIDSRKPPEKVPKFLWDVKYENFGWIGKNFTCHDYGQFYNMIHYPKGMKKINWNE